MSCSVAKELLKAITNTLDRLEPITPKGNALVLENKLIIIIFKEMPCWKAGRHPQGLSRRGDLSSKQGSRSVDLRMLV
jgi:hypothetical protein